MPKAKEVASELRKLADSLDKEPDAEISTANLYFSCNEKGVFQRTAKLLPRPLKKERGGGDIEVIYGGYRSPLMVKCYAPQNLVCKLVQEAVYECEPLLSEAEEAALETAVAE